MANANANKNNTKKRRAALGRWLKRVAGLLVLAALIAATVFAFLPKPVPVETAEARLGPLAVTVDEDGKTRVIDRYLVSAPLGGTIGRIELHPGDAVEAGDLLTTIEAIEPPLLDARTRAETEARLKAAQAAKRQAQAGVGRAKAAYEFAKGERARVAKLVDKGSYAKRNLDIAELDLQTRKQEYESARFGVRVAQYELETAKAALRRIDVQAGKRKGKKSKAKAKDENENEGFGPAVEVRSPITGTVLRVIQEQEGVVSPGTPIVELADPDALEIVVDVLTSDAVHIHHGDPVRVHGWGGREPFEGAVRLVEPSAFTKISALGVEEQRVNVIIDLTDQDEDPDQDKTEAEAEFELGDGYRVEVAIEVWSSDEVLQIPVSALFRADEQWAVWIVEDGLAHERRVEVGKRQDLSVEILDGLEPGERVIVHPSDAVAEGVELELPE